VFAGRRNHNLVELPLVKLKAVYKFLVQLYVGGAYCIMAIKNTKAPPHYIMEMLKELSTVPQWIQELKQSASRQGAMYALTRAKAYLPEIEPALLADSFPEFNADGSEFTNEDYVRCMKETRVAATNIAVGLDLEKFQAGYSEDGKRMSMPDPKPVELNPPRRKQNFAPDVNPSTVMKTDSVFEAVRSIQWVADEPPIQEAEAAAPDNREESAQVDPSSSSTYVNPEGHTAGSQP
jgi:hypothetical protein